MSEFTFFKAEVVETRQRRWGVLMCVGAAGVVVAIRVPMRGETIYLQRALEAPDVDTVDEALAYSQVDKGTRSERRWAQVLETAVARYAADTVAGSHGMQCVVKSVQVGERRGLVAHGSCFETVAVELTSTGRAYALREALRSLPGSGPGHETLRRFVAGVHECERDYKPKTRFLEACGLRVGTAFSLVPEGIQADFHAPTIARLVPGADREIWLSSPDDMVAKQDVGVGFVSELRTASVDIETYAPEGFPSEDAANAEMYAVAIHLSGGRRPERVCVLLARHPDHRPKRRSGQRGVGDGVPEAVAERLRTERASAEFVPCKDEADLVSACLDTLRNERPTILLSFNGNGFDWRWIFERAKRHGVDANISPFANWHVDTQRNESSSAQKGKRVRFPIVSCPRQKTGRGKARPQRGLPGMINLDLLDEAMKQLRLTRYSLDSVAEAVLGGGEEKKVAFTYGDQAYAYVHERLPAHLQPQHAAAAPPEAKRPKRPNEARIEALLRIVLYVLQDARLPRLIADAMLALEKAFALASFANSDPQDVVEGGMQTLVYNALARYAHEWDGGGFIINNTFPLSEQLEETPGAFVLDPIRGVHAPGEGRLQAALAAVDGFVDAFGDAHFDKMQFCLDFASLYPSVIQAFNLCYRTAKPASNPAHRRLRAIAAIDKSAPVLGDYLACFENPNTNPEAQAVLPVILENWRTQRNAAKKRMRKAKAEGETARARALDAYQLAIKVLMNSLYGFLSARKFGKLPLVQIGAATTAGGRGALMEARRIAMEDQTFAVLDGETRYQFTATADAERYVHLLKEPGEIIPLFVQMVYGDTDSIMPAFTWRRTAHELPRAVVEAIGFFYEALTTQGVQAWCTALGGSPRSLVLENENLYMPTVHFGKKMYIFVAREPGRPGELVDDATIRAGEAGGPPKLKSKGVATARGDKPAAMKSLMKDIQHLLLMAEDGVPRSREARALLDKHLADVVAGRMPALDMAQALKISKETDLAKALMAQDASLSAGSYVLWYKGHPELEKNSAKVWQKAVVAYRDSPRPGQSPPDRVAYLKAMRGTHPYSEKSGSGRVGPPMQLLRAFDGLPGLAYSEVVGATDAAIEACRRENSKYAQKHRARANMGAKRGFLEKFKI